MIVPPIILVPINGDCTYDFSQAVGVPAPGSNTAAQELASKTGKPVAALALHVIVSQEVSDAN